MALIAGIFRRATMNQNTKKHINDSKRRSALFHRQYLFVHRSLRVLLVVSKGIGRTVVVVNKAGACTVLCILPQLRLYSHSGVMSNSTFVHITRTHRNSSRETRIKIICFIYPYINVNNAIPYYIKQLWIEFALYNYRDTRHTNDIINLPFRSTAIVACHQ